MEKAENYYKDRVKKKLWLHLDEDQETIIALKAQLTQRLGGGDRRKKKTLQKTTCKDDMAWKSQPLKPGEPKKKQATLNGTRNTYYWCQHHAQWTIHKPQDCQKKNTDCDKKSSATGDKCMVGKLFLVSCRYDPAFLLGSWHGAYLALSMGVC